MQPTPTIIAIDPGYDRCGVAVMTELGGKPVVLASDCITTKKTDAHEVRLAHLVRSIRTLIEEHQPVACALETLFFSVNKKTAIKVAEARGAIAALSGMSDIPLIEVAPQTVKIALTGVGNAGKDQVEKMVRLTVPLPKKETLDDEIDAIALGVAALGELKHKNALLGIAKKNSF